MISLNNMRALVEFIVVLLCSLVFGAGIGFIQGVLAISGQKTEITLQFGGWAALTGMGVSGVITPVLYYWLIRNNLSVAAIIELAGLTSLVGALSAYGLGRTLNGGWLSWIITVIVAIVLTILYCRHGVRITAR